MGRLSAGLTALACGTWITFREDAGAPIGVRSTVVHPPYRQPPRGRSSFRGATAHEGESAAVTPYPR